MPVTTNPEFPGGISATNIPTLAVGDTAANAGAGDSDAIGLSAWGNALLNELTVMQNAVLDSPPLSPTIYDDEFNEGTLNTKWTLVTGAGCTQGLVAPTYFQQNMPLGAGVTTTTATEVISCTTGFMFQFRVKWIALAYDVAASPFVNIYCGLLIGTTKSFGLSIIIEYVSADPIFFPLIEIKNGNTFGTIVAFPVGPPPPDMRIRLGMIGSNLVAQISSDGINWLTLRSEVFTTGGSLNGSFPTSLQLGLSSNYVNKSGLAAWDYVRKIA